MSTPDKTTNPAVAFNRPLGHCEKCGRFASSKGMMGGDGPDLNGEYSEVTGICTIHGRQILNWERT